MAITTSGNISIKGAAGNANSIEYEIEGALSGNASLATLSQASNEWTGSTRGNTPRDTDSSPYGMLEFSGYAHSSLWETTGTVAEVTPGGKISTYYELTLADMTPDNAGGTIAEIRSYRGGAGMWIEWSGSLNTNWVSLRIGTSSSSYTTLTRTGNFNSSGNYHYTGSSGFGEVGSGEYGDDDTSPQYITNTNGATMYFEIIA